MQHAFKLSEEIATVSQTAAVPRVLIAEDEPLSRRILEVTLTRQGFEVVSARDGSEAWDALQRPDSPRLAVLDWVMPGVDGIDLCRRLKSDPRRAYVYTLLVTAKQRTEDVVAGLEAGADDFLTKPYEPLELRSRLRAGERILQLETRLQTKVSELEKALGQVRQLEGLLPICMHCKRIRDQQQIWHGVESYIAQHSGASFSHSLCEPCLNEHYPE